MKQNLHKTPIFQLGQEDGAKPLASDSGDSTAVFKPLTRSEADAVKKELGGISLTAFLLKVLVWQAASSIATAALVWWFTDSLSTAISALYGASCAVLPTALVFRTVIKRVGSPVGRLCGDGVGWMFGLEVVKVLVTVVLLLVAPLTLSSPHWVAIVVGFVVALKVYWLVALVSLKSAKPVFLQAGKIESAGKADLID